MDAVEFGFLILLLTCSSLFAVVMLILFVAIIDLADRRFRARVAEFAHSNLVSQCKFYLLGCDVGCHI